MTRTTVPTALFALRILAVLFVCGLPSPLSAQWTQGGINWRAWPSGSSVGDCFGNCGAGCSDSPNGGCSGSKQYWQLTLVSGPAYVGSGQDYECDSEYGNMWTRRWDEYHATGRWSYHGWVMPGCITHDLTCNQFYVGCLLFFGCGGPGWNHTWSYNQWMRGYAYHGWEYFGSC
jgi:hypothetical protein